MCPPPHLTAPVDDLQAPIGVFDQGRKAFDPVAIVAVQNPTNVPHFGMVDVSTHHPIGAPLSRLAGQCLLEVIQVTHGPLDLELQVLRE